MGEVYRARDERLEREVAIKVLPERLRESREALARFEREAKAVAALSHPGVLTLFDIGTEGGLAYAVTELLEGETLRVRLATTSLPWPKAVEIAAAVADGMAAAHQRGIVHRDLKPENIFLTTDGRVKILDFGLARIEPAFQASTVAPTLTPAPTEPGTVMGTVGYMSPEQVRGQEADARSDIFSFGCVLYELVTGTRAFHGATTGVTIAAILRDEPADPAGSGKPIPADLSRLIVHCLEKNADERFQSFRDLAFGLRAVMNAEVTTKTSSGGRRPIDSLAVLPFANQSGDPDAEYLSDGIAESILQALSRLSGLRVMARTTRFIAASRSRSSASSSTPGMARSCGRRPTTGSSPTSSRSRRRSRARSRRSCASASPARRPRAWPAGRPNRPRRIASICGAASS